MPRRSTNGAVRYPTDSNLEISKPNAADAVYYTLDGSDPRLPGGGISPSAFLYNEASGVTLTQDVLVQRLE